MDLPNVDLAVTVFHLPILGLSEAQVFRSWTFHNTSSTY